MTPPPLSTNTGNPRPGNDQFPAFVVRKSGDEISESVEMLTREDLPAGDILIEIQWSAINYKDAMVTVPGNRVAWVDPLVPGVDMAGIVVGSPPGSEFPPGTSVIAHGHDIGVARHGGFAAMARIPADWVVALPDRLDTRQAMILGTAGFTSGLSIDALERHGIRPADGPILVTGASGGVGSTSVCMLASLGYAVVASTGKVDEHEWLRSLGATQVIGRDELEDHPQRSLGLERYAGAIDCVGGQTLSRVLRLIQYGGAVAASGLTGGSDFSTTVYPFIIRNVALLGIDSAETPNSKRVDIWSRLATDLRPADLNELVARECNLSELEGALAEIIAAKVRGRILVRPVS